MSIQFLNQKYASKSLSYNCNHLQDILIWEKITYFLMFLNKIKVESCQWSIKVPKTLMAHPPLLMTPSWVFHLLYIIISHVYIVPIKRLKFTPRSFQCKVLSRETQLQSEMAKHYTTICWIQTFLLENLHSKIRLLGKAKCRRETEEIT